MPRVLERAALVREVPEVAVERVDLGRGRLHRHVVRGGVGDGVFAGANVPGPPGSDDVRCGASAW